MSSASRPSADVATVANAGKGTALKLPSILLTVLEGPDRGTTITAQRGVVRVGTARDNDLVLSDDEVSRRHLEVRLGASSVRVVDLGSTNGTTVDGVTIHDATLTAASRITLGNSTLRASPVDEPVVLALSDQASFGGLIGESIAMRQVFGVLERVAPTNATVVLEGETGTGKEVAAEAIHAASPRHEGPFVAVDCGAIPESLIESELFGHVRGAFTGAVSDRQGVFEMAHGGTLFLDEIGELPLALQPKLLRALEKREVRRLGDSQTRRVDVRVVAATNRDLAVEVNRGAFREDLYFRLAVVRLALPPLRARSEDIPMLIAHFVRCLAPGGAHDVAAITASLTGRSYAGNVRELRNAVERALAIGPLPPNAASAHGVDVDALLELPYKEGLALLTEQFERRYLKRALDKSGGSVSGAARLAGLSRRYVQTLMARHGLRRS